jgi:hypothetical protein
MSKAYVSLVLSAILALSVATARAEEPEPAPALDPNLQVLIDTIRANRKALVAVNLGLSAEQGAKFWPLYDRYQQEVGATGDRVTAIVEDYIANYGKLSDDKALELMEGYLAAEAERVAVRRKYVPEFAKILPGREVTRFYQIENKMDAVLRYDLASAIPVIPEKAAAPAK